MFSVGRYIKKYLGITD
jgi:hypothetical protein